MLAIWSAVACGSRLPRDHTDSEQIWYYINCLWLYSVVHLMDVIILQWVPDRAYIFRMRPDHSLVCCLLGDYCVFADIPSEEVQDTMSLLCTWYVVVHIVTPWLYKVTGSPFWKIQQLLIDRYKSIKKKRVHFGYLYYFNKLI